MCIVYIFPFFEASFKSSGTFFYPILGNGWRAIAEFSPQRYDSFSNISNISDIINFFIISFKDIFFVIVFFGTIIYLRNKYIYLKLSLILHICFFIYSSIYRCDDISLREIRFQFFIDFISVGLALKMKYKN